MKTDYNTYELSLILKMITHRENKHDAIVVISGSRGMGKSVLGMNLMRILNGESYFTEEAMRRLNIYQPGDLTETLDKCPDNSSLLVDEAINVLFKRDFAKKSQKVNIKIFNTHRDKRLIVFLLVPNFFDIDSSVRNSLIIKFWIHVHSRGKAWIFTHENNPATDDPWCRSNIFYWHLKGQIYRSHNFIGNLQFKNIKDPIYKIYQEIKKEKRLEDEFDNKPTVTLKDAVKLIYERNPGVSSSEVARILKTNQSTISTYKTA